MTTMTRAEYEAKYGAPPAVSASPVRMTRAEYQAKYGNPAIPAPTIVNGHIEGTGRDILDSAQSFADALGFKKTTETIGKSINKATLPASRSRFIDAPSAKDVAGAALNVGSLLIPTAAVERVAGGLLFRVAPRVAAAGAKVAAGVTVGAGLDAAQNLENDRPLLQPGLGTALGAAGPLAGAAARAAVTIAKGQAPKIINSLIKPLSKGFSYGKDPGRAVSELGITGNSFEDLEKNIALARTRVGQDLEKAGAQLPPQATTNLSDALSPFDDAIKHAVNTNDQALYGRLLSARDAVTHIFTAESGKIEKAGTRLLDGLTYSQGIHVKRILGDLTKWTGQKTEDESVNGALVRSYGLIKDKLNELAEKYSPTAAAQLRKLNEQYADLTSAEVATKYRDVLQKRQNLVNLPGKIGLTGALVMAPFTGGISTITAAVASVGIDKALSSPAFKTRLAAWLAKAPAAEKQKLVDAVPELSRFRSPGDLIMGRFNK